MMRSRVVSLIVLLFWLASGLGSPVIPETIAAPAEVQAQATTASPSQDRDYDGLTDDVETNGWWNATGFFKTDPLKPDSDEDGLSDGEEKLYDTDPLDDHSPGVYVEYEDHLRTRQYSAKIGAFQPWGWQQRGDRFITFDAVVVRRGSTFSVGGPADATIQVVRSLDSLTDLTPVRDPCTGRWRISVPPDGTVGKYRVILEDGDWSKSLDLYVIFELPTPNSTFTQQMIDIFLYDDDPEDLRDEIGIQLGDWKYTHGDYPDRIPWDAWINAGSAYRFELQPFEPFVFEEHVIEAINGRTGQWGAARDLVAHADRVTRFDYPRVLYSSWTVLHPGSDDRNQCSNIAGLLTAFERSAGIPARPFFTDWVNASFDHAVEVWVNGAWHAARGYVRVEPEGCGWDCGYGYRSLRSRYSWGRYIYVPWHSGGYGRSSTVMAADANWAWAGSGWSSSPFGHEYRWPSWDWDAIVRYSWFDTLFDPYWTYWGWNREPTVTGSPPYAWPAVTDFAIAASPDRQTVSRENSTSFTIILDTSDGFSNLVDLSVDGLPVNTPFAFSPNDHCVPDCNRMLVIDVTSDTPLGTYALTISGESGGLLREATAELVVTDFTIDASPDEQTVAQGESTSYVVTLGGLNGFDDIVGLSVTDLPAHTTPDFSSDSCVPDPECQSTLSIFTAPDTPTGRHTLTIHGDSGALHHQTGVDLIVTEASTQTASGFSLITSSAFISEMTDGESLHNYDICLPIFASSTSCDKISDDGQASLVVRGVDDHGVDPDGDGYLDQLVIEIEVDAAQPGTYWLQGELGVDHYAPALMGTGGLIAATVVRADLAEGTNVVQLPFDGLSISGAKQDGPYVLKYLSVTDEEGPGRDEFANRSLGHWSSLYTTATYRAYDFENRGVVLSDRVTERGLDADGDGRYESLIVDVGLDVFEPGTYTVQGDLYDGRGKFVAQATWTGSEPTASLQFDALPGTVGPYTLKEIYLLNADGEIIDSMVEAYTAQQVIQAEGRTHIVDQADSGQFRIQGILPDAYSDYGLDLDHDGLYDLLAIGVPVEAEEAGEHRLEGWLEAEDGHLISWASSQPVSLTMGTHTISLTFSGLAIYAHGTDGPFTLVALKLLRGDGYEVLDEVDVAYTTPAYTRDQFESLPYLDLSADQMMLFEDHMEDGEGDWTADPPWALTAAQYRSPIHAWTDSPGGDYANNVNASLVATVPITAWGFSRPMLQFRTCYALETGYDYGYVEVSADEALTWTSVATYTGSTVRWSSETMDLGVMDEAETLQVRFRLDTDPGVVADGWYVDDVVVYLDNDLDDDGIPNDVEVGDDPTDPVDTDGDGRPDYLDEDSDGDGIPDAVEAGEDPTDPVDTDGDGRPDYVDGDSDGDDIPDAVEAGEDPTDPVDTDGDGRPDYRDDDSDGDGIPDAVEAGEDPTDPVDTDSNGRSDYVDDDSDGDGIPDAVEAGDDPTDPVDTDGDDTPDYVDDDSDGDGLLDTGEWSEGPGDPLVGCTADDPVCFDNDVDGDDAYNYLALDSDGDGIPDAVEAGGDPSAPVDTDGDGVPDWIDTDSDGDGIPDAVEAGEEPSDPVDTDGDGSPDYLDDDSDGDGIPDAVEAGEDPSDPVDTDGDGRLDYVDDDSDGDGILDTGEWSEGPGDPLVGCTADDPVCFDNDVDGDGVYNYLALDSDGDGIPDAVEVGDDPAHPVDTDGDGLPDWIDTDSDGDGVPDRDDPQPTVFNYFRYLPLVLN